MVTKVITDNTTGGDFTGTDSAVIVAGDAATNFGTAATIRVDGPTATINTPLKFPGLSNITGPVTVSSATISLYKNTGSTLTIEFHRLLRAWVELEVTWNVWKTGSAWTTAGGTGADTDRAAAASYSASEASAAGVYIDITSAALAADVQAFINGTQPNYGWLASTTTAATNNTYGSEDDVDARRPKLTVVYTPNGAPALGRCIYVTA